MTIRKNSYSAPQTTRSIVLLEGCFCTSIVKDVEVTVELDEEITIEHEISFD